MDKPKVSIIVPTHNSGATLEQCLRSIHHQNYSPIEIILVDNLSIDTTIAIAARYKTKIIRRKSTPASARNMGIVNSTGKYVFLVDSDQVLSPSVIEQCVEACEDKGAGMVRVPEVFVGKDFWGSCSAEWKNIYGRVEQKCGATKNILAGDPRFFTKEAIVRAGMFNDGLVWGEDYDLYKRARRMNVRETWVKSELCHYEPTSIRKVLFKSFRYGNTMPTFARRTKQRILWPMVNHSLLALKELLREQGRHPAIVAGCAVLFCSKALVMAIGLMTGSLTRQN
jgi:glycosyltransferase involved in cell wall biosynthesis